jgi:hypothetical protein
LTHFKWKRTINDESQEKWLRKFSTLVLIPGKSEKRRGTIYGMYVLAHAIDFLDANIVITRKKK